MGTSFQAFKLNAIGYIELLSTHDKQQSPTNFQFGAIYVM